MKKIFIFLTAVFIIHSSFAGLSCIKPAGEKSIRNVLQSQVDAWNHGDIYMYMEGYWKSDSLRFIGKNGIQYGWKNTLDNYIKSYPDKATMGILAFEILSVEMLSGSSAYVVGKWSIKRGKGDVSGYYTLLFQLKNGKWVITCDHSS